MSEKHPPHNGRRKTAEETSGESSRFASRSDSPPIDDALSSLAESLAELREHVQYFAQVRIDQFVVALRNRMSGWAALGLRYLIALAVAVIAVTFVLYGTALGLATLCGDRAWLGFLLTGLCSLTVLTAGAMVLRVRTRLQNRRRLEEKYARMES